MLYVIAGPHGDVRFYVTIDQRGHVMAALAGRLTSWNWRRVEAIRKILRGQGVEALLQRGWIVEDVFESDEAQYELEEMLDPARPNVDVPPVAGDAPRID